MSSASAGQFDSFPSMKSTPEIQINSLQITNENLNASTSPNIKSESPILDDILFDESTKINLNRTSSGQQGNTHNIKQESTNQQIPTKFSTDIDTGDLSVPQKNDSKNENSPSKIEKASEVKSDSVSALPQSSIDLNENGNKGDNTDSSKVSAYARLEFENFIFYVQTLQVVLGRKSEHDQSHSVDVHLGASKAISRKHAKIFYNFGTERFELSIQGKNGAFVDDVFIERGATVPLTNKSKIQIGQIVFRFVLPGMGHHEKLESPSKPINPSEAISLRSTLYTSHSGDSLLDEHSNESTPQLTSKDFEPVKTSLPAASAPVSTAPEAKESSTSPSFNAQVPKKEVDTFDNNELDESKRAKEKKPPKAPKPPKKVYTIDEIPEEYRTKPACSYSNLIATCLRTHGTSKGMSLADIYKSIRDIFPYYKYCPDGWQSSVRHNLSLNKAFRKVSKEGKGWLWGLDEEYCAEKERLKKKQAAAAAAKAKATALKLEQQQQQQQRLQQQRSEQQKQLQLAQAAQQQLQQHNLQGQTAQQLLGSLAAAGSPLANLNLSSLAAQGLQGQQLLNAISQVAGVNGNLTSGSIDLTNEKFNIPLQANGLTSQLPSAQADQSNLLNQLQQSNIQLQALAASLPQQSPLNNQALLQAQAKLLAQQLPIQPLQTPKPDPSQIPVFKSSKSALPSTFPTPSSNKTPSIQAQLAANRGIPQATTTTTTPTPTPTPIIKPETKPVSSTPSPAPAAKPLGADTKKALAHLQQQLVLLSKDLRTLVDKPTISAILTQAIAMTIAQVTQAAKTKGITTDPLATLIESNPNQLTRILTVALNAASYKVTNGRIKNPLSLSSSTTPTPTSRASTPVAPTTKHQVSQIPKFTPGVQPHHIQAQQAAAAAAAAQAAKPALSSIPLQNIQPQSATAPKISPSIPSNKVHHIPLTNTSTATTQVPIQPITQFVPPQTAQSFASSSIEVKPSVPTTLQQAPVVQKSNVTARVSPPPPQPHPQVHTNTNATPSVNTAQNTSFTHPEQTSTPLPTKISNDSSAVSVAATNTSPIKNDQPIIAPNSNNGISTTSDTAIEPKTQTAINALVTQDTSSVPVTASSVNEKAAEPPSSTVSKQATPEILEPADILSFTEKDTSLQTTAGLDQNINTSESKDKNQDLSNIPNFENVDDSLKFFEEDLNDPEFSKVLESLSKEGTPGVDEGKVMNDDEIDRLLSSDFTDMTSGKRTFEQVDEFDTNESKKLQRI